VCAAGGWDYTPYRLTATFAQMPVCVSTC